MNLFTALCLLLTLSSCSSRYGHLLDQMTSIQLLDRNGFSETISIKERLHLYENSNFYEPQPYQKVMRLYGKVSDGKTAAKITTYHPNGLIWQYLDVVNGRAFGTYQEWHSNGQLKIDAYLIEGTADVTEMAQMTWVFDRESKAFDRNGNLLGTFTYQQGKLQGPSIYYYPSGKMEKIIPYHDNVIDGSFQTYYENGNPFEIAQYKDGRKHGLCLAYDTAGALQYQETYEAGRLQEGQYFLKDGKLLGKVEQGQGKQYLYKQDTIICIQQCKKGVVDGLIQEFDQEGRLTHEYHLKENMKDGDEWFYYPCHAPLVQPKLFIPWQNNMIYGVVKSWYDNGNIESQREFKMNQKDGTSFAWFKAGGLMLIEEYENSTLTQGSYFDIKEGQLVSKIENGKGTATLFDEQGRLIQRVLYEKGSPVVH